MKILLILSFSVITFAFLSFYLITNNESNKPKELYAQQIEIQVPSITSKVEIIAGTGERGFSGDGGQAILAKLDHPMEAIDHHGDILIADTYNHRIRKIDKITKIITTIVGNGNIGIENDGNFALSAEMNHPKGIDIDSKGNIYIADNFNNVIRKFDSKARTLTTVAGSGDFGPNSTTVPALTASFYLPMGVTVDNNDNVLIVDWHNNQIRKLDTTTWKVETIAGTSIPGFSGDNQPAIAAQLNEPRRTTVDNEGNIYIADTFNNRIRKISVQSGKITTIAGNGRRGFNGDGILATEASLNNPMDVDIDKKGNIFIADTANERIRMIDVKTGIILTVPSVRLATPTSIDIDEQGQLIVTDKIRHIVFRISINLDRTSKNNNKEFLKYGEGPSMKLHIDQNDINAGKISFQELLEQGKTLMNASFNTFDGAGRPESTGNGAPRERREFPSNFNRISGPDASACSGCHNLPFSGGGGDNVANVFLLAQRFGFVNFDQTLGDDFFEHTLENVGNERNTLGMFGSGFIELLAREMTSDLHQIKETAIKQAKEKQISVTKKLITKGVNFGEITAEPDGYLKLNRIEGVDEDLIIKPFHQKGLAASLREFTVRSINAHHGIQATEMFGLNIDADNDGVVNEITAGDITALTLFQATLPMPSKSIPKTDIERTAAIKGEKLFSQIGCNYCHISELPLSNLVFTEPSPYNPPGVLSEEMVTNPFKIDLATLNNHIKLKKNDKGEFLIPVFTDLKRHNMGTTLTEVKAHPRARQTQIPSIQELGVEPEMWLTKKLWGLNSEPPFLHHGRATLLSEAIIMHDGEGLNSRNEFIQLSNEDQAAIIEFLQTLEILHQEPQLTSLISKENETYSSYLIVITGILMIFIFLFILKRIK